MLTTTLNHLFGKWVHICPSAVYQAQEEKIAFMEHFTGTLLQLEKQLHSTDSADEILQETFRTACEFYEADWAGFLELNTESHAWWPLDWYKGIPHDQTLEFLEDFEPTEIVQRWLAAMERNEPLVVTDRETIREDYPEEYQLYQRVGLHTVLAVPVKPRPCGFLAVRNPKRYVDASCAGFLQLLAFVVLSNINDKAAQKSKTMIQTPEDIQSSNDIYIKLFGDFQLLTDSYALTAKNAEWPYTVPFLSFLAVRNEKTHRSYELEDIFFRETANAKRSVHNMVSHARKDLMPLQKPGLLPPASNNEGYQFGCMYNVKTDLMRFDELYNTIMQGGPDSRICYACQSILRLYEGDIQLDVPDDYVQHAVRDYHVKYFFVADRLMQILEREEDYEGIRSVAEKALQLEPGHPDMYFWLITAYGHLGVHSIAKQYLEQARQELSEEEWQDIQKRLQTQNKL